MEYKNRVVIIGTLDKEPKFSHISMGVTYYKGMIDVKRLSGVVDRLPIVFSQGIVDLMSPLSGRAIRVWGEIKTHNRKVGERNPLIVEIYAHRVEEARDDVEKNHVELTGVLCKTPTYRVTPFGREISDMVLVINRPNGKRSHIPCIAWGDTARFVKMLDKGDPISLVGRMQSREYQKMLDDGRVEKRITYEVSINRLLMDEALGGEEYNADY